MIKTDYLKDATGELFVNHKSDRPSAPVLKGHIRLSSNPGPDGEPFQRIPVKAWIRVEGGSPSYALSFKGMSANLHKVTDDETGTGVYIRGTVGSNRQLEIIGRKCISDDGETFIRLMVQERGESNAGKTAAD